MSIKNFKNPWAEGGEYYPDWLGGEKVLGQNSDTSEISCNALITNLKKSRPNWMNDNHYSFCKDICTKIIDEAIKKKCSSYGIAFLCAMSANETGYGTSTASKNKNNYWGLRSSGGTKDEDFSSMTFGEAFEVFWEYLYTKWPDMILFLQADSYSLDKNVLKEGPYYFTSEEINQCLNSGRYGGNGNDNTPKIISGYCYNAEYYSENIDYGLRIIQVLTKYIIPAFRQTATENFSLAKANCEEAIPSLSSYSYIFGVILTNRRLIESKSYGRYMSEVSKLNQDQTTQILRPNSGISKRIIIPNSKNVFIPKVD